MTEVHPQDWEMTGQGGYEEDTGWAERQPFMQSRHRAVDYVDTCTDSFSEPSCHVQIKGEPYEIVIILTINYNSF